MANQNEQKTYCNGLQIKEVVFQSGKSILKMNVNVARMIEFLQKHQNDRGYCNLGVSARNSVGQYGDTHCAWLDTWEPDPTRQQSSRPQTPQQRQAPTQQRQQAKPQSSAKAELDDDAAPEDDDGSSDVPF